MLCWVVVHACALCMWLPSQLLWGHHKACDELTHNRMMMEALRMTLQAS